MQLCFTVNIGGKFYRTEDSKMCELYLTVEWGGEIGEVRKFTIFSILKC